MPLTDEQFDPADWTEWARNLVRALRVGGVWAAPGPPPFIVRKDCHSPPRVTVTLGALDARTARVFRAAGIAVTYGPGTDPPPKI